MAGSINLNSILGGQITITAADSANTNYLTIPAANGIAVHSVANTGYAANTGATIIASGNTAQRPISTSNGAIRFNTSNNIFEVYNGIGWSTVGTPSVIEFLVVAGGGGAGGFGGAGGAGGVITGNLSLISAQTYTITVGAGGAGAANRGVAASNGSVSFFAYVGAAGGGFGGSDSSGGAAVALQSGQSGGSGGGASYLGTATAGLGNTPAVTPVQGFNGSLGGSSTNIFGGAGGGAGGAAGTFTGPLASANGGVGISSSITGSAVFYGGGGGGPSSSASATGGVGGNGGGGNGGKNSVGIAGTTNTGGGAGGCWTDAGIAGGSGVVILSIPTAICTNTTTGSPIVTVSGTNTILKYNSSGTYTA